MQPVPDLWPAAPVSPSMETAKAMAHWAGAPAARVPWAFVPTSRAVRWAVWGWKVSSGRLTTADNRSLRAASPARRRVVWRRGGQRAPRGGCPRAEQVQAALDKQDVALGTNKMGVSKRCTSAASWRSPAKGGLLRITSQGPVGVGPRAGRRRAASGWAGGTEGRAASPHGARLRRRPCRRPAAPGGGTAPLPEGLDRTRGRGSGLSSKGTAVRGRHRRSVG